MRWLSLLNLYLNFLTERLQGRKLNFSCSLAARVPDVISKMYIGYICMSLKTETKLHGGRSGCRNCAILLVWTQQEQHSSGTNGSDSHFLTPRAPSYGNTFLIP